MATAAKRYEATGEKQRLFTAFDYAAGSWRRLRWVIAKAEHSAKGANPRFIITNIVGDSQQLYDRRYCARGEMENRIKEQMMLFADRVSAHRWWANQWRILLSALAYTLMVGLRRREGVNMERLARQERLETPQLEDLRQRLAAYERRGLLCIEGPRWRLADPAGLALSNGVLREMLAWWEELEQELAPAP